MKKVAIDCEKGFDSVIWLHTPRSLLLRRSSLSAGIHLCLHRGHVCRGLPFGFCLLLLPYHPDGSGTDHQRVVLLPSTLQPWSLGQPASHARTSLVYLLALSFYQITFTWWWNELQSHWITGAQPVATKIFNVMSCLLPWCWQQPEEWFPQEKMRRSQRRHEYCLRLYDVPMVFSFRSKCWHHSALHWLKGFALFV